MKKVIQRLSAVSLAVVAVVVGVLNSFAVNPYGISYNLADGDEALGADETITVDPNLVSGLVPLLKVNGKGDVGTSFTGSWTDGYWKEQDGSCWGIKYIPVQSSQNYSGANSPKVSFVKGNYSISVDINAITLEDVSAGSVAVGIIPNFNYIYGGIQIYTDSTCNTKVSSIKNLEAGKDGNNGKVFIDTTIKLKDNLDNSLTKDDLYFRLQDIDAAQSYKIMNRDYNNNFLLAPDNMFVSSVSGLNPSGAFDVGNYYSRTGYYIYSSYDDGRIFEVDNTANIYVGIPTKTQGDGLNMVFGYAHGAASGVEFYAPETPDPINYTLSFNANGGSGAPNSVSCEITSGTSCDVIVPSGIPSRSDYVFEGWSRDAIDQTVDAQPGDSRTLTSDQTLYAVWTPETPETPDIPVPNSYVVQYQADEGGKITGRTSENVEEKGNPLGSEATPDRDFTFKCWTANQDITLKDGAEIELGSCITDEQITQVVVDDDIVFTAHFTPAEVTIFAPETGSVTDTGGPAQAIMVPFFAILGSLFGFGALPQIFHKKKVKFTKH